MALEVDSVNTMHSERVDLRKMNLQLIANVEKQDRSQCRKNEASRVISFVCRARKHVANAAADDRPNDAEHGCPEDRHMDVHYRFRDYRRRARQSGQDCSQRVSLTGAETSRIHVA
jgi:hypothetical protein